MNSLLVKKTLHRITLTQKSEGLAWPLIFPYECYEDGLARQKSKTGHQSGNQSCFRPVLKQAMRFPVSFICESDPIWALF